MLITITNLLFRLLGMVGTGDATGPARDGWIYCIKVDFIAELPLEIVELILSYLDHRSLCLACRVSPTWYQKATNLNRVWKYACTSLWLDMVICNAKLITHKYTWRSILLEVCKRVHHLKSYPLKESIELISVANSAVKPHMKFKQVYPLSKGYILVWMKHLLKDHLHLWKLDSHENQKSHEQFSTIWVVPFCELFPARELVVCTSQVHMNVIQEQRQVIVTCKGLFGDGKNSCQWNTLSLLNGKHVHRPYTCTISDQYFEMATCSSCGAVVYISDPPERIGSLQKIYALYRCDKHDNIRSVSFSIVHSEEWDDFTGNSKFVKRLALLPIRNGNQKICHQHNMLIHGPTNVTVYQIDLMSVGDFECTVLSKTVLNVGDSCSPFAKYGSRSVATMCSKQGTLSIYNPSEATLFTLPNFVTPDHTQGCARYQLQVVTPFYAIICVDEDFHDELYVVFFPSTTNRDVTVQKLFCVQTHSFSIACTHNILEDYEQIPMQDSHQSRLLTLMYACTDSNLYSISI